MMWRCDHCGESSEDQFDSCWHCGTARDGTPPPDPQVFEEPLTTSHPTVTAPCLICGAAAFSWGGLHGHSGLRFVGPEIPLWRQALGDGDTLTVRRCDTCGNLQCFDSAFYSER